MARQRKLTKQERRARRDLIQSKNPPYNKQETSMESKFTHVNNYKGTGGVGLQHQDDHEPFLVMTHQELLELILYLSDRDTVKQLFSDCDPTLTTESHWDCGCRGHYIHKKQRQLRCRRCGACADDQPDSRVIEVVDTMWYNPVI